MSKTIFGGKHKILIDILIDARKAAGLRQDELGKKLGKNQTFISLIENYQRRMDIVEFCDYARALGIHPERLFMKFMDGLSKEWLDN